MTATAYRVLADAVLVLHSAFVGFVVLGLALVLLGAYRGWGWVRYRTWRLLHLGAIGVVVAQAWLGILCPLTTLETWLRGRAGDAVYTGGFIAHWLERALYYEAPAWVFTAAYTLFALAVIGTWFGVPPRPRHDGA